MPAVQKNTVEKHVFKIIFLLAGALCFSPAKADQDKSVATIAAAQESSSQEPETIAEISFPKNPEIPDNAGEIPAFREYFERNFTLPENNSFNKVLWEDAEALMGQLMEHTEKVLKRLHINVDSAAFVKMVNQERLDVRNSKGVAGFTMIGDALCIRITHFETEEAILVGPREVLNPTLPRTSRFQKYVSRVFTFSGKHSDFKVRGRSMHLVRIGDANQAGAYEYLKKPRNWISGGWYKHYINAAFSKPAMKHATSAFISTMAELGMLFGLQSLYHHATSDHAMSNQAIGFAVTYSFTYGLFANGIRMINNFGASKFFMFLKLSGWNLAYTVPFAILTGQDSVISVVGWSFLANKSADVQWSQIIKFDEHSRVMEGDYILAKKRPKGTTISTDILGVKLSHELKFNVPEINLGSKVTLKSIAMRMPRFALKILSIVDPTVGLTSLLASIPIMAVISREYAEAVTRSGKINEHQAERFIANNLDNIWTRAWELAKFSSAEIAMQRLPLKHIKHFISIETSRALSEAHNNVTTVTNYVSDKITQTAKNIKNYALVEGALLEIEPAKEDNPEPIERRHVKAPNTSGNSVCEGLMRALKNTDVAMN